MDLYVQLAQRPEPHVNALVNLAVLHEDRGEMHQAERCLRKVLDAKPMHARARLFMKDVSAGKQALYDEGGDDTYSSRSALTVGNAALETLTDPGRLMRPTAGIFLDGAGTDTYDRMPAGPVGNDRVWSQRIHPEAPSERGFGADGVGTLGLW